MPRAAERPSPLTAQLVSKLIAAGLDFRRCGIAEARAIFERASASEAHAHDLVMQIADNLALIEHIAKD